MYVCACRGLQCSVVGGVCMSKDVHNVTKSQLSCTNIGMQLERANTRVGMRQSRSHITQSRRNSSRSPAILETAACASFISNSYNKMVVVDGLARCQHPAQFGSHETVHQ